MEGTAFWWSDGGRARELCQEDTPSRGPTRAWHAFRESVRRVTSDTSYTTPSHSLKRPWDPRGNRACFSIWRGSLGAAPEAGWAFGPSRQKGATRPHRSLPRNFFRSRRPTHTNIGRHATILAHERRRKDKTATSSPTEIS